METLQSMSVWLILIFKRLPVTVFGLSGVESVFRLNLFLEWKSALK